MPKPALISLIPIPLPPVTGIGKPSAVYSNLFDHSGTFRQRNNSFKRQRRDEEGGDDRERVYDLTKDFPPLSHPQPLRLNLQAVRELMVKATAAFESVRSRAADSSAPEEFKELAVASGALMDAVGAIVELAIVPMAGSSMGNPASTNPNPNPPSFAKPRTESGTAELRAALASAEKSAVVFDVDLGQSAIANRNTLNASFTNGIKNATLETAKKLNADVDESVRIVNDALSCVDNLDFLGKRPQEKSINTTRKTPS
jgi:hypothetical protein